MAHWEAYRLPDNLPLYDYAPDVRVVGEYVYFSASQNRYRSVILSLTLSVILFVTGSAFGSTLKGMAKELTVEVDGDISFYADEMPQDELLALHDRLKTTYGVSKSTWQANLLFSGMVEELPADFAGGQFQTADELPVYAQFIEDAIYYEFIESLGFSKEAYSGQDAKVLALILDSSEHKVFSQDRRWNLPCMLLRGTGAKRSVQLWWITIPWICFRLIPRRNMYF